MSTPNEEEDDIGEENVEKKTKENDPKGVLTSN
jgi:hypothetical protein